MSEVFRKDVPIVATEYQIENKAAITRTKRQGTVVRELAVATFDTAGNDSSGVSNKTVAAHGLGVYLPAKAIVTRAWFQVVTGFTSASTNTGTIALSVEGANDLKTATAVSDAMYGTAIMTDGVPVSSAATSILLTAVRELTATVAVAALTAGKLNLFVDYVIAE